MFFVVIELLHDKIIIMVLYRLILNLVSNRHYFYLGMLKMYAQKSLNINYTEYKNIVYFSFRIPMYYTSNFVSPKKDFILQGICWLITIEHILGPHQVQERGKALAKGWILIFQECHSTSVATRHHTAARKYTQVFSQDSNTLLSPRFL